MTVTGITYVNVPKNVTDNNYLRVIVKNTDSWIRLPKGGAWESLKTKQNRTPQVFLWGKLRKHQFSNIHYQLSVSNFLYFHPLLPAKLLQSCPTLYDPTDGSPPSSPVPGILQARTLEWAAISFSNAWKWKVKVKSLSCARLLATPWTAAYQAPPSMGFSRQEYWSGVHFIFNPTSTKKRPNKDNPNIYFWFRKKNQTNNKLPSS